MGKKIVLDGRRLKEKEGVHKYLKRKFHFPAYYGNNLDALHDCLTEISDDTKVVVRYARSVRGEGGYGEKILEVLGDSAEESAHLKVEEK